MTWTPFPFHRIWFQQIFLTLYQLKRFSWNILYLGSKRLQTMVWAPFHHPQNPISPKLIHTVPTRQVLVNYLCVGSKRLTNHGMNTLSSPQNLISPKPLDTVPTRNVLVNYFVPYHVFFTIDQNLQFAIYKKPITESNTSSKSPARTFTTSTNTCCHSKLRSL